MDGVERADVVTTGELVDIALKMLVAHAVVGTVVATLEHAPEALHSVRMGLAVHILRDRVAYRLVILQASVRGGFVGVDLCAVRNLASSSNAIRNASQMLPGVCEGSLTRGVDEAGNPTAVTKDANTTLELSGTPRMMARTRSEESIRERPLNGI